MASLPPQRPASQRKSSPPAESSVSQQEQLARQNSFSGQFVDSQTLLLNSPPKETTKPILEEQEASSQTSSYDSSEVEEDEPRRCWICFNDETEDDETSSEWRSPCTCSLEAHESCLLDWIADMEAPSSGRRAGTRATKIQCPQCKSEIKIARPRSLVVDVVRAGERLTSTLLLPGFVIVTGTALYSTLTLAGTHTIYQIFGTKDALQILAPLYQVPDTQIESPIMRLFTHLHRHWRLDLGLPLIPTVLVASRTSFADSFLPFLPLIFFVSSGQPGDEMLQLQWPPSAAFTFAALPYIRGFYNAFYERVCLPREQRWLKEIQPRAGTEDAADAQEEVADEQEQHLHDHDHDAVNGVEIELDFDIFADWNNGGEAEHNIAEANHPQARPIDAPPLDHQEPAPAPNVPLQPAQPRPQHIRRERNIAFSTSGLADTILGALIFPSIAAAMGEILRCALPASWVTPPSGAPSISWLGGWIATGGKIGTKGRPTGFLQTRWGRSLIGGCLFVGLKDAVLLYVRWRTAQMHRRRRILDHDPKDKARARAGAS
ncbi:hypothetical protein GQ44DRAFT_766586 [Phaeosphaeriaceae sp. PMI808]|nr:hypothetical protein GQ44DRAFT_766586 [Phaeosphaeriaceae sp. PMI808]